MCVVVLYSHEVLLSLLTLFIKSTLKFENQFQVKNLMLQWKHLVPLDKESFTEASKNRGEIVPSSTEFRLQKLLSWC